MPDRSSVVTGEVVWSEGFVVEHSDGIGTGDRWRPRFFRCGEVERPVLSGEWNCVKADVALDGLLPGDSGIVGVEGPDAWDEGFEIQRCDEVGPRNDWGPGYIIANILPENVAMRALAARLGFEPSLTDDPSQITAFLTL